MSSRIVLAHGTFDLLHVGHMILFEKAQKLGDRLIVTITADEFVNKGPGRPIYGQYERRYAISRLKCVDEVHICAAASGVPMIERFRPNFYVKGGDYRTADKHGHLEAERQAVERLGGHLIIIDTPQYSSTDLIERVARWSEKNNEPATRGEGGLAQ